VNTLRVISYATPRYRPLVDKRLAPSCVRLGIQLQVFEVCREFDSWHEAARHKADVIAKAYGSCPDGVDLLWLDADAELHADPRPYFADLAVAGFDVACGRLDHELLTGTLWFAGGRQVVVNLLNGWRHVNANSRGVCDQRNFDQLVTHREKTGQLRLHRLPPAYCFIFDTCRERFPSVAPVIEHHQASRKFRMATPPT
jgi:hypothetical protein